MKFLLYTALLVLLVGRTSAQTPALTLVYPALDQGSCLVMLPLPAQYQPHLGLTVTGGVARIGPEHPQSPDSLYTVRVPAQSSLASFFITSERLQPAKTPTPAALAEAIIRQHRYYRTAIEEVSIQALDNSGSIPISKLSFRVVQTGQYMVNYILFVNNRSVTIGTAHISQTGAHSFDGLIRELRTTCP